MLKKKSLTQLSRGQEIRRPKQDDQIKKTIRQMNEQFIYALNTE